MGLTKRTYSLPAEVIDEFEKSVMAGKRSVVLAELISKWLEEQEQLRLRSAVVEGLREMSDVYLETEQEYHSLEEEIERT